MDRERKSMLLIIGIIVFVIVVIVIAQVVDFRDKERQAVQIAQEYLNEKYEQEMEYKDIRKAPIEPGVYHITFSPAKNPEVEFEVTIPNNLIIPERVRDFGQSNLSADNYYNKYFEYQMEKYLVADVNRLWGDTASIRVTVMDIDGYFDIPSELNDTMSIEKMESYITNYWIVIRVDNMPLDNKSLEVLANKIFDFIQIINNEGFTPEGVGYYNISEAENKYTEFSNLGQIETAAQVLEQLETEFEKEAK